MAGAGGAVAGRLRRGWVALVLLSMCFMVWPPVGAAQPLQVDHDYLIAGAPTAEQAPLRACSAEALARMRPAIEIPAPEGGWSGAPQGVGVFNVFAGEVMIFHGDRQVCGDMQDARTRDSRFRAGVGLVVVPKRGTVEPIRVAWESPLKPRWIPTVHLGAPSPLQQQDTLRLVVRTACVAIALALALSALMGFATTRGRDFLIYTLVCALLVVWQAVLSGLSGYPEPWLPVDGHAPVWMVSVSALSYAVMGGVLWRMCGGRWVLRGSRRWMQLLMIALALVALAAPFMTWPLLARIGEALDDLFTLICIASVGIAIVALRRGYFQALDGLVAVIPLLVMALADLMDSRLLVEFRVEAIQVSVTWFLMMSAYSLNRSLSQLRQQRDEMRALADTDTLTGLPNRRAGLRQLEHYMSQAKAAGQPLSIGFLDIDLFKQINDRYGHDGGDQVLVSVAGTLLAGVRSRSDVIRMGGEEFLILLPGIGADAARPRLEQLREKVTAQARGLKHEGLVVTASIGLAELQYRDNDVAALLRRADNAMYQAKRSGRDQVVDARDIQEVA
ncbi:diguanylate cyclase [Stenotrophomonas sp. KCTC 12332]|nr:diguanylate cyclase [Stenotrophomonas sp. KCTC 12332]